MIYTAVINKKLSGTVLSILPEAHISPTAFDDSIYVLLYNKEDTVVFTLAIDPADILISYITHESVSTHTFNITT